MVINRQNRVRVQLGNLDRFLARVLRSLRLPLASATVCFVSDAQIAKWNRAYRGKPRPTDVLSFPVAPQETRNGTKQGKGIRLPGRHRQGTPFYPERSRKAAVPKPHMQSGLSNPEVRSYLGDIAIAPAVARRNAHLLGRSPEDELRVLILHGVLHLLGYDHETDRGEMVRLELRLRRRLGIG